MSKASWEGLIESEQIKKLSVTKKNQYHEQTIPNYQFEHHRAQGWELLRENLNTKRVRLKKPCDEMLEDYTWYTFSRMGFEIMNSTRNFRVPVSESETTDPIQIDVFAIDQNVALVVECEATSASNEQKSIKEAMTNIIKIKANAIKSIKSHFYRELKVGFILVTDNLTISPQDKAYAKENNICLLNDGDLEYYNSLADNIGVASKYQLLSDVFENRDIPTLSIEIPAVRGKMGNNTFYSFVIEPSKLLPISYVSHRTKNTFGGDKAYQRMIKKKRLIEIEEYIEEKKGLFPNSIILNIHTGGSPLSFQKAQSPKNAEETVATLGYLTLPNRYKSAWVIDGQHRLYGFSNSRHAEKVTIPVIAFENLDVDLQADMFIDINSKQVKVSKNLLEELHSDLHWDSPNDDERIAALISRVAIQLSKEKSSPLNNRIKFAEDKGAEKSVSLTSLTDALKKNKLFGTVEKQRTHIPGPLYDVKGPQMDNSLCRSLYILSGYFSIFREESKNNWDLGSEDGGYLCTNNAITSEIIVLSEIIKHVHKISGVNPTELEKEDLLEQIDMYARPLAKYFNGLSAETIKGYRRRLGGQGQKDSAYEMMIIVKNTHREFNPNGLENYIKLKESKWNEKSAETVRIIQDLISKDVIHTIKGEFGEEDWWKEGVPQETRKAIVIRREEDKNPGALETYFTLIEYNKIILKNWRIFKEKYGIKRSEGNSKDDLISWYEDFNRIRNKVAHPERGLVTEDEYYFLDGIKNTLEARLTEEQLY